MSVPRYKSTKIPSYVLDGAELAKAKIMTNFGSLDKKLPASVLKPTTCPICQTPLKGFELRTNIYNYQCPKCSYKQPGIDVQAFGTDVASLGAALGHGVLFGLGIAALLHLLSEKG